MSFTTPLPNSKINQCTRDKLGEAIYLLAHIIKKADWKTGKLRTTHEHISYETGFPAATVKKWIQRLVDVGEIICERTIHGSIITIRDYAPIARTRGVRKTSRKESIGTTHGLNESTKVNLQQTTGGPNVGPLADPQGIKNGPNHVIRILSQNKEKNSFQILSSSFCDKEEFSEGEPDRPVHRRKIVEFDMERQERIGRDYMVSADEASKKRMIDQALESMESDARPFVRIFVRRNERGEREFVSHSGDSPLMARIGLLLEAQTDDS